MGAATTSRRRHRRTGLVVLGLTAFSIGVASPASATKPDADGVHTVTICHRTNSDTNPYNVVTVDYSAANGSLGNGGNDHSHHDGPAWNPTLKDQHIKWGDIIPPYTYSGGSFPGLNWDAQGQAIHDAGCGAPSEEPPCPTNPSIPASDPFCNPE